MIQIRNKSMHKKESLQETLNKNFPNIAKQIVALCKDEDDEEEEEEEEEEWHEKEEQHQCRVR
jgi:hypothetical protein